MPITKKLPKDEMPDSVMLRNKELLQKCSAQSQRLHDLMRRCDEAIKAAQALIHNDQ
jgi:hypothetical protein